MSSSVSSSGSSMSSSRRCVPLRMFDADSPWLFHQQAFSRIASRKNIPLQVVLPGDRCVCGTLIDRIQTYPRPSQRQRSSARSRSTNASTTSTSTSPSSRSTSSSRDQARDSQASTARGAVGSEPHMITEGDNARATQSTTSPSSASAGLSGRRTTTTAQEQDEDEETTPTSTSTNTASEVVDDGGTTSTPVENNNIDDEDTEDDGTTEAEASMNHGFVIHATVPRLAVLRPLALQRCAGTFFLFFLQFLVCVAVFSGFAVLPFDGNDDLYPRWPTSAQVGGYAGLWSLHAFAVVATLKRRSAAMLAVYRALLSAHCLLTFVAASEGLFDLVVCFLSVLVVLDAERHGELLERQVFVRKFS
ncbi:unnamed protein product [Amoebophrya sp. A120]|nr:unnamed protein product [Amoebophrya sp. A120]|eukprot:GSA120T00024908001.1